MLMYDVIEYHSNACTCAMAREREKKLFETCMYVQKGLLCVKRNEYSISSMNEKQLSFVCL